MPLSFSKYSGSNLAMMLYALFSAPNEALSNASFAASTISGPPVGSYLVNVQQNDFKKIYRAKTPTILESKSEIRSSKSKTNSETNKPQIGKIQNTESDGSGFGILPILLIEIVSNFGFRASNFLLFAPLRLCASRLGCASAALGSLRLILSGILTDNHVDERRTVLL